MAYSLLPRIAAYNPLAGRGAGLGTLACVRDVVEQPRAA